jgi:hypothetical protein
MRRTLNLFGVVFLATLVCCLGSAAVSAQCCGCGGCGLNGGCQNQVCTRTGGCYKCFDGSGTGCSVAVGDCTKCTGSICAANAEHKLNVTPTGPWSLEWAQLCAVKAKSSHPTSQSAKMLPKGAAIFGTVGAQLDGKGAALPYIVFGLKPLLKEARLLNLSQKKIVGYRLGWAYTFPTEQPEIVLGDWMDVPAGISSGTFYLVPERAGQQSSDEPVTTRGANSVMFFVAALRYADGTSWREDTNAIKKDVDRTKPQIKTTPTGVAGKSATE